MPFDLKYLTPESRRRSLDRDVEVAAVLAARRAVADRQMGPPPLPSSGDPTMMGQMGMGMGMAPMAADPAMMAGPMAGGIGSTPIPPNTGQMAGSGAMPTLPPTGGMAPALPPLPQGGTMGGGVPTPTGLPPLPPPPDFNNMISGGQSPLMMAEGGQVMSAPPPTGAPPPLNSQSDKNPAVISTSDRPIFPGVPPAEMMIELMGSQNPEQSVGGLLQQLAKLTHRGAGSEEGLNIPETSPQAERHFSAAPEAFRVWLGTVDPAEVNELGDSLKQAADANPDDIDELWSIVQGLAQKQPELLPDSLISILSGVKETAI